MREPAWTEVAVPPLKRTDRIVVIGAGIAGCSVARTFAELGVQVLVLEALAEAGLATSGNPAALILPYPTLGDTPFDQFYNSAYALIQHWVRTLEAQGHELEIKRSGALHLLHQPRLAKVYAALEQGPPHPYMQALAGAANQRLGGSKTEGPCIYYPQGLSLNPGRLCRALLAHKNIRFQGGQNVATMARAGEHWQLLDGLGKVLAESPVIVFANAEQVQTLCPGADLPLITTTGQLVQIPLEYLQDPPQTILCAAHYIIPNAAGKAVIGATWRDNARGELVPSDEEQAELIEAAGRLVQLSIADPAELEGRKARRTGSPDHLPLVGPLPDAGAFRNVYKDLHLGRDTEYLPAPYQPGLFVSCAHGARGFLSAPASAYLLASLILDGTPFNSKEIIKALNPARFLMREMKRSPIHR